MTVAGVSQSHKESDPLTESSVCTATGEAIAARLTPGAAKRVLWAGRDGSQACFKMSGFTPY